MTWNIFRLAAAHLFRIFSDPARRMKLNHELHPDYMLDPDKWIQTVEKSMPSGIFASLFAKKTYAVGEKLQTRGEVSNVVYFLKEGAIEYITEEEGSLGVTEAPSTLGEIPFFAGTPSMGDAVVVRPVTAIRLGRKDLESLIKRDPKSALELFRALAGLLTLRVSDVRPRR